jgi:uncharacterized protein (UPF0333 family)
MKKVVINKNKNAQMKISFSMIFSIVLIIAFLAFGFYAINGFLDMSEDVKLGQFKNSFQKDVIELWKSQVGTMSANRIKYPIPNKIELVCLIDTSKTSGSGNYSSLYPELKETLEVYDSNIVFYPIGSAGETETVYIPHLNIANSTQNENPLCFEVENGKVSFALELKPGENLVTVKKG